MLRRLIIPILVAVAVNGKRDFWTKRNRRRKRKLQVNRERVAAELKTANRNRASDYAKTFELPLDSAERQERALKDAAEKYERRNRASDHAAKLALPLDSEEGRERDMLKDDKPKTILLPNVASFLESLNPQTQRSQKPRKPFGTRDHCSLLVQSLPPEDDLNAETQDQLIENCMLRYEEFFTTNQRTKSPSMSTRDHAVGVSLPFDPQHRDRTDLCVLDLDQTLISSIETDVSEKRDLIKSLWEQNQGTASISNGTPRDIVGSMSGGGINVLRKGVMELIDTLHESSADVVIYSLGSFSHVVFPVIFMEMTYNRYWRKDGTAKFRFNGVISTPGARSRKPAKSFSTLKAFGYPLSGYKHIMVVDDQHRNVWDDNEPMYLALKHRGKRIVKMSVDVFGNSYTKARADMSHQELLQSFCIEREYDSRDGTGLTTLMHVTHQWKILHEISREEWLEIGDGWIPRDLIAVQCERLVYSLHMSMEMVEHCKARYRELLDSNKPREKRTSFGPDLCVLDLDDTLLTRIPLETDERGTESVRVWNTVNIKEEDPGLKAMMSIEGINILRDGTMDLIEVLHQSSSDVVIYAQGHQKNVIFPMIFMEFAYNQYWEKNKRSVAKSSRGSKIPKEHYRPFQFAGMILMPSGNLRPKAFVHLQLRGYPLADYKRIMVVDDQANDWLMTKGDDYVYGEDYVYDDLMRDHKVRIMKMSNGRKFGDKKRPDRSIMSPGALVGSILHERKQDTWLFEVTDQWEFMVLDDGMQDADWERIGTNWMG